jgi:hypothetical protein
MAGTVAPNIVTDGLIFYYDASNIKSLVSGSNTMYDLSKKKAVGTLINTPTYKSENGGSLFFDFTNESVDIPNSSNLTTNERITVMMAFKPALLTSYQSMSSKKYLGDSGWEIGNNSPGFMRVTLRPNPSTNVFNDIGSTSISPLVLDEWYIGAFTYESGSLKLYHKGNLVGTTPASASIDNTGILYIGKRADGLNTNYTSGSIANVLIYDRALSADEIKQNYNATKTRFGI